MLGVSTAETKHWKKWKKWKAHRAGTIMVHKEMWEKNHGRLPVFSNGKQQQQDYPLGTGT